MLGVGVGSLLGAGDRKGPTDCINVGNIVGNELGWSDGVPDGDRLGGVVGDKAGPSEYLGVGRVVGGELGWSE